MVYTVGSLVVVRRYSGTQIAYISRAARGDDGYTGFILSAKSATWSKTHRKIPASTIIGGAGAHASAAQKAAIRRARDCGNCMGGMGHSGPECPCPCHFGGGKG